MTATSPAPPRRLWQVVLGSAARGVLVGLAVITSCSGVDRDSARPRSATELAEDLERSPCGGGDLRPMPSLLRSETARRFEDWPLPPVFISAQELDGDAVACFDGDAVLVHEDHAQDQVILAHEFCHAVAYLFDRTAPQGFPSPEPNSARAQALEPEVWHQEIWAVSCSTAVTGDEDWSWGHLVHDSTPEAQQWAATFVARGPQQTVDTPVNWARASGPAPSTP